MARAWTLLVVVLSWSVPASADWLEARPSTAGEEPAFELLDSTTDATTVLFDLGGLWFERAAVSGRTVAELEVPGGATLRELGRPATTTSARLLAVPPDADLRVEVLDADVVWMDAPPPAPAEPHPTRRDDPTAWWIDDAFYDSDETWPADMAVVEGPALMRQLAVARLEIRTTRYDFERGQLGILRSARIVVHHAGQQATLHPADIDSPAFAHVYAHQVFNYELPEDGIPAVPESMLVIVEEALVDALQPLVDWKIARGMQVTVRTLEEVGTATEDVQAAIDEAYETWDPQVTYVMLVGDNVPFYRGTYDNCASDYLFTTLEGNDLLPDVLISRVVAEDADDVSVQVNKFLSYEMDPPLGEAAEWMRHATGAATNEAGMSVTDEQRFDRIAISLEDAGYTIIDKYYVTDGSGSADNVKAAFNEGRGWLVYLGHGSGYDFSSLMPPFGISHAMQLTNTDAWPFLTDCSCLNGGFDGQDDSLDELLMKLGTPDEPTGTLGVFGSSTSTSWDPAGDIAEGASYGFLDHGQAYWGAAAQWGRTYVFENWGSGMDSEWLFQQWVLFGDPSLMMRTRPPIEAEITYPAGFGLDETEFTVTVAVEGEPFAGATVALRKDGDVDAVLNTDETGAAVFDIAIQTKGPMDVVVTGRDLAPHVGVSDAGSPPGGLAGCSASRSPFNYNPSTGFGAAAFTGAYPAGSSLTLAGLGLLALVRRLRRG